MEETNPAFAALELSLSSLSPANSLISDLQINRDFKAERDEILFEVGGIGILIPGCVSGGCAATNVWRTMPCANQNKEKGHFCLISPLPGCGLSRGKGRTHVPEEMHPALASTKYSS